MHDISRRVSSVLSFITLAVYHPDNRGGGHPFHPGLVGLPHHPPVPVHLRGPPHMREQPNQPQHQAGPNLTKVHEAMNIFFTPCLIIVIFYFLPNPPPPAIQDYVIYEQPLPVS